MQQVDNHDIAIQGNALGILEAKVNVPMKQENGESGRTNSARTGMANDVNSLDSKKNTNGRDR